MPAIALRSTVDRRRGHDNDLTDILKLKLGLDRLGLYRPEKPGFMPGADDAFWTAFDGFQAKRRLERDGIAEPDGPTVAALNADLMRAPATPSIGARAFDAPPPSDAVGANRRLVRSLARRSSVGDLPAFVVSALKSQSADAPAEVADLLAQTHAADARQAGRLRGALDDYLDDADLTRLDGAVRKNIGRDWDATVAQVGRERRDRDTKEAPKAKSDTPIKDADWRARYPDLGAITDPKTRLDLPDAALTPEYRDRIAAAETNRKGYEEFNPAGAWGRYQMTNIGLRQIGMKDINNKWTGKYGVHKDADFLGNPEIQETAFEEYTKANDKQLSEKHLNAYIGQQIVGQKATFSITEGGLAAAAHREGAGRVRQYLKRLERNGWTSDIDQMPPGELRDKFHSVETRLRTFERVRPFK